jgi:hypothetical protein
MIDAPFVASLHGLPFRGRTVFMSSHQQNLGVRSFEKILNTHTRMNFIDVKAEFVKTVHLRGNQ